MAWAEGPVWNSCGTRAVNEDAASLHTGCGVGQQVQSRRVGQGVFMRLGFGAVKVAQRIYLRNTRVFVWPAPTNTALPGWIAVSSHFPT